MRRALIVLPALALALLGGCGKDDDSVDPDVPGSNAKVDLTITVTTDEGAEPKVMNLTCQPTGGDHPNAGAACDKLADTAPDVFEAVPDDQACTMIYGGPQKATITGTYQGDTVDASFSRANGCEIDRWDTLGTEVFDVPLQ